MIRNDVGGAEIAFPKGSFPRLCGKTFCIYWIPPMQTYFIAK